MKTGVVFCLWMMCSIISRAQVDSILPIDSSNIQSIRDEISDILFGDEIIPEFELLDSSASKSILSVAFPPQHMGKLEVGVVRLKHGFTSRIFIVHPAKDNGLNIPIIYHSGHGYGVFREDVLVNFDAATITHFLSKGFTIVGIDMPFFGENKHPAQVTENNVVYRTSGHDDLFFLDHPFYYFLAPIKSAIDYLQANRHWNEFVMYGLSGGGWATTLYSAIDPRIRLSFPVAGTIPIPLRQPFEIGDVEQYYPPFYKQFTYSTLYFLGAAGRGRKQYQILIKKDQCCFRYDGGLLWEKQVDSALTASKMPGTFDFLFDTASDSHRISTLAIDSIQANIINGIANERLEGMFTTMSSRASNIICDNDTLQLQVSDTGTYDVVWYCDGEKVDSTSSHTFIASRTGRYTPVIHNLSGAVISLPDINIEKSNMFERPSISIADGKLHSSYATGNKWYYNGKEIRGATGPSLQVLKSGRYTVRAGIPTCLTELSDPLDIGVVTFPNPSSSQVAVRVARSLETISWSLRTMQGAEVKSGTFVGETVIRYNSAVKPGVYFLYLKNRNGFTSAQKILVFK